jgi:uncharacterized protein YegP (UPF0339 family)
MQAMTESEDRFEVYRDRRGRWRWRRFAPNGRIVGAASEGYAEKADAEANMRRGAVATDAWTIYQDRRGQWRWRRAAQNGKVVCAASEGYAARADCEANAARHGRC